MSPQVTITLPLFDLVVSINKGESVRMGRCICCGARGWTEYARHGLPHGSDSSRLYDLTHREGCVFNQYLDKAGDLKPEFLSPRIVPGEVPRMPWWRRLWAAWA